MAGRVLVIDDEVILRNTLTRVLQSAGCEVNAAADGYQAFRLLEDGGYDLVFLDIHLPEMDGLQILKEVRSRLPRMPVILLTGYGSLQSAVEALRLGATDYLLKPFDPEVLIARTRIILKEQATERRKQELLEQIENLQAELRSLEQLSPPAVQPDRLPTSPHDRFLKRGRLILDLQARRATFGEIVLSLPPATFDYLEVLARHSPDVVDYRSLVTEAQNYQVGVEEARELAKWHIYVLRQALEADPDQPNTLLNVRGVGYRLLVD